MNLKVMKQTMTMRWRTVGVTVGLSALLTSSLGAQESQLVYENNFENAAVGAVPDEKDRMLVLDGGFAVREESGNKFLELPGAPLESFGVLFGPSEQEDVAATARVWSTGKGRRFPTFGLGLNGQGGYRLQVAPAKKVLELIQGDAVKASVPFEWTPGQWTALKLEVRKTGEGEWKVSGKVWHANGPEPVAWTIATVEKQSMASGRSSIWASPFAGTPIRFDDLRVTRVVSK